MFAPLSGVAEDPATGSANCTLGGLLATHGHVTSGMFSWRIAQGVEMGRPSTLSSSRGKERRRGDGDVDWWGDGFSERRDDLSRLEHRARLEVMKQTPKSR